MGDSSSLQSLFQAMELDHEKVSVDLAEEWISANKEEYFGKKKYGKFVFEPKYKYSEWHKTIASEREQVMNQICENMKKKEVLLTQILCLTSYNYFDSKSIISALEEQFHYFTHFIPVMKDPKISRCIVDINIAELPVIGQILAPLLAAGFTVQITDCGKFSYFCLVLGEIFSEAGLPQGAFTISEDNLDFGSQNMCIKNPQPDYYCPVIVFEDADLDGAVECILQGAWKYNGEVCWAISHVYIQESIFKIVTDKLKMRFQKMKIGSRFVKSSELLIENISVPLRDNQNRIGHLEVFQPIRSSPVCLYIGWDPSDFEDIDYFGHPKSGISLVPFRTASEAAAMANKVRFGCAVSLWTERLSTASKISDCLEFGTVWINSHGLFHPSVPFESEKDSKFPINGMSLIRELLNFPDTSIGKNDFTSAISVDRLVSESSISKDICTAMEKARGCQKIWSRVPIEERFQILCDFINSLNYNFFPKSASELKEVLKAILLNARFEERTFIKKLFKMEVICTHQPFGIIWLDLLEEPPLVYEQLIIIIISLLIHGNSVIISAHSKVLKLAALHICEMFQKCKISNQLVNYVLEPFLINNLLISDSNEFRYCKAVNRIITVGKCDSKVPFGLNVNIFKDNLDYYKDANLINLLTVHTKCKWFPAM